MAWEHAASILKGSEKPAKKISHVTVKHAANGGHIITHHHTSPEHHEDEQHTTKGDAAMMAHMQQAMPDQAPAADPTGAGGEPAAATAGAGPNPATGAAPMSPGM